MRTQTSIYPSKDRPTDNLSSKIPINEQPGQLYVVHFQEEKAGTATEHLSTVTQA